MYNHKTARLYGDIYTEIKIKGLTIDLNKQIDNTIENQQPGADILLFKGAKKQSTWVSSFLTKTGIKDGSKTNNTGSINLLRHSYIDYIISMLNKQKYSAEERNKLANMMKHSVQTSPSYSSMVVSDAVPLNAKQKKEIATMQTRSKSKKQLAKQ
jgi:hypothetical protein